MNGNEANDQNLLMEEVRRINNEEMQTLLNRVNDIRSRAQTDLQAIDEELSNSENFIDTVMSKPMILVLAGLLPLLMVLFYTSIKNVKWSIKQLESHDMWGPYIFAFFFILIIIWLYFTLFAKLVTLNETTKMKEYESKAVDILYLNPFYINVLIYAYDKAFLSTPFDIFILTVISSYFATSYFFSLYLYNYFKIKIASIANLHLNYNIQLMTRLRASYGLLIAHNVMCMYLTTYLLTEVDFMMTYLIQFRSVYLILKQIEYWYINELSYKQLDNVYFTNEQYYLKTFYRKTVICFASLVTFDN